VGNRHQPGWPKARVCATEGKPREADCGEPKVAISLAHTLSFVQHSWHAIVPSSLAVPR
jgi:hypothetical protein